MRGTATLVNASMAKPILYMGVERGLVVANTLVCYPIIAATYLKFPACLFGVALFIINHSLLAQISKYDPNFAKVFRRFTRYCFQSYIPARSHPLQTKVWQVETVGRP